jgi:alkanesulfonate monooxygenase SsuD/methylene tetrahydromethanopterin reductase-like flavin-dependent oxidoreductase (luciferase family)
VGPAGAAEVEVDGDAFAGCFSEHDDAAVDVQASIANVGELQARHLVGTPTVAAARLGELAATGATDLVLIPAGHDASSGLNSLAQVRPYP